MHIRQRILSIFSLLAILSFQAYLVAQPVNFAKPGPQGIYLFLGDKIPSGKTIASYEIERRESKGAWQPIAEIKAPATFQDFKSAVEKARQLLPSQPLPQDGKLQQIYDKAIQSGTTDSLKGTALQYPVKIGLGLIFYDATATKGKEFQYRLTEINPNGIPGSSRISEEVTMPFKASFDEVTYVESSRSENTVYIKWKSTGKNSSPLFMIHRVEGDRPVIAGGRVGRYSMNDTTFFTFTDSLGPSFKDKELKYFLTPYDLLGNAGHSSQTVVITSDNFTRASFLKLRGLRSSERFGNQVSWHFSDPPTAAKMDIYRSESPDKGFVQIKSLTSYDTAYLDESIKPEKSYYYYIQAISRSGKRFKTSEIVNVPAFTFRKLISPAIHAEGTPTGVKLMIDSIDQVATGIRIFRTMKGSEEMTAITELIPLEGSRSITFVDSSGSLSGRQVYTYAARAEKPGYGISELSSRVSVKPGLSATPPAPSYLKAFPSEHQVQLYWENMQQSDSGITMYQVVRNTLQATVPGKEPFSPLAGPGQVFATNYLYDTTVVAGNSYIYIVNAIDSDGKAGAKAKVIVTTGSTPVPPVNLKAVLSGTSVSLTWEPVLFKDLDSFKLYRSGPGEAAKLMTILRHDITGYLDESVTSGNWSYYLTSTDKEGRESAPSSVISISKQ